MLLKGSDFDKSILNAAEMATLRHYPSSNAANAFVNRLYELTIEHQLKTQTRKRRPKQKDIPSIKATIGAFAADLLLHSQKNGAEGFMYRPSDPEALKETLATHDNFQMVIATWPEMDLVDRIKGSQKPSTWEGQRIQGINEVGYASRYRATQQFFEIAKEHRISLEDDENHFSEDIGRSPSVRLKGEMVGKGRNGRSQHLPPEKSLLNTPAYLAECQRIDKLNAALAEYEFSLTTKPRIQRHFSNAISKTYSFDQEGRLYAASGHNWLNMHKSERSQIRIDGEETVEVDVRASHLFIWYAMNGRELKHEVDPYASKRIPRAAMKQAVVMIFGSSTVPSRWPRGNKEKFLKKEGFPLQFSFNQVLDEVLKLHPILERAFTRPQWASLQYEESECILDAMERLIFELECPSLPIHDSLIVKKRQAETAKFAIARSYMQRFGFAPVVRESSPLDQSKAA
ncbi:hypothetical protein [Celeribacter neptunius]|uniref:Uncharacterized protein n=1 Tax=Celeribacter neptunius TaxID=588602 RepID=A0A1I3RBJ0_9RHOB|nr:hypothetical protein [Celeribacter neptunius]SFJ43575.1 hypothetical protein SAMN04487991_2163 [Celeribacter neptunius]